MIYSPISIAETPVIFPLLIPATAPIIPFPLNVWDANVAPMVLDCVPITVTSAIVPLLTAATKPEFATFVVVRTEFFISQPEIVPLFSAASTAQFFASIITFILLFSTTRFLIVEPLFI